MRLSLTCRVVKVLFDTGSTEARHQQTAVSLAGSGAHTIVSKKNVVFNLLLINELKPTTELLPTSIDLIKGQPTIRKHDLVLKIPSHFTNKSDGFADIVTSCVPAEINLFGTVNGYVWQSAGVNLV